MKTCEIETYLTESDIHRLITEFCIDCSYYEDCICESSGIETSNTVCHEALKYVFAITYGKETE
jgi:hypothetical protein